MDASVVTATSFKYRAFISYSHRDRRWAEWLHKAIERYRVPKPLLGQPGRDSPIPKQIFPVFRDRDELASSADLSASIRAALWDSAGLVVVCSPAAAKSLWVDQEIREFKRLGRGDRILAVIIDGEPNASSPDRECFPPALRFQTRPDGALTDELAEPVAADLRAEGDGKDNAKLKLIAGLLGVSFNDLRQRELIAARRRVRIYQGVAATMILLAVLATVGGWMAWRYAKESEARLGQAIDIAAGFVAKAVRLSDSFGVPRSAIEQMLAQAELAFGELMEGGTRSPRLRSRHALLLMVFADHYGIIGKTERQWDAAKRARDILQELVTEHPSNPEWSRQLAVSHDLIGDILANRLQLNAGLTAYRASQFIRGKLSADDPRNPNLQRDLSLSDNKIGDILFRQGHLEEALAAFQAAREISDQLTRADPENLEWQRDVLVIHHKIGDVLAKQGDLNGAGDAYRASLAIAERLAAGDPSNAQLQRDLSASQEKVGNILADQGDMEAALAAYRTSLALAERLAAADPSNVTIQRDLSLGHANVGRILMKQHQPDTALDAFRASLAIAERLVAADPMNPLLNRDLSMRLNRTGDALAAQGELQVALDHYRRSLAIRERLAAGDPSSAELQRDVSMSHDRIGNLLAKQGQVQEAVAELQASLKITARLAAADSTNAEWQRDLYASYRNLGLIEERRGNIGEARDMYCQAKSVALTNSALPPGETEWRQRLDWLVQRLAPAEFVVSPC